MNETPLQPRQSRRQDGVPEANIVDLRAPQMDAEPEQPASFERPKQRQTSRRRFRMPSWRPPSLSFAMPTMRRSAMTRSVWRSLLGFIIAGLVVVAPIAALSQVRTLSNVRDDVLSAGSEGAQRMTDAFAALQDGRNEQARADFTAAGDLFAAADEALHRVPGALLTLGRYVPGAGSKIRSGEALIAGGRAFARAGLALTEVIGSVDGTTSSPDRASDAVAALGARLPDLLSDLRVGSDTIEAVDPDTLPEQYRPTFHGIAGLIPVIQETLRATEPIANVLPTLLGLKGSQRYLLLFQNSAEMRPTGGFIGSIALLDIRNGTVSNLEVPGGGSYDMNGQLTEDIISPQPLHLVNPLWYLQDANWWPDFPTSAQKAMWFYEHSGGPTVDGVLAITPTFVEDILKITGSINLENDYGVTVTSENFVDEATRYAEETYDSEVNQPKAFIRDTVTVLFGRLYETSSEALFPMMETIATDLHRQQILFYHTDPDLQREITDLDWGGTLAQTNDDTLMVVHTNIAGGKTDRVIDTTVRHQAVVAEDGSITDTVTLQRTHHGASNKPFTGVKNTDYVRFYVPEGSQLTSSKGFSTIDQKLFLTPPEGAIVDEDLRRIQGDVTIDEYTDIRTWNEMGYTVFANWLEVQPGEAVTASITYRLPWTVADLMQRDTDAGRYAVLLQQQPGDLQSTYIGTIDVRGQAISYSSENLEHHRSDTGDLLEIDGELIGDILYGIVLE